MTEKTKNAWKVRSPRVVNLKEFPSTTPGRNSWVEKGGLSSQWAKLKKTRNTIVSELKPLKTH